jgi:two-component system nitrogen regulation response regulator NtrX
MKKVLIVDDEKHIRESLEGVLSDEGYDVSLAEGGEEALKTMRALEADAVLLDIWMPGMDGMETLRAMKALYPEIPVIMVSGHGTVETAVKATKLGAYDFLEKPLSLDKVVLTVQHAIEKKKLVEENAALVVREREKYKIMGVSGAIKSLLKDIEKVGPTNSWVLITGENGTGKELVARSIHNSSKRATKPFVAVNCAAIPDELIESELFGHEKGAFTSAVAKKIGRFDMADGGTLFLDEIGDMSLRSQAKVLRILQEQSFERVGGTTKVSVDVRVLAATNKDLMHEMKNGRFREDLYYRLNVIPFHVPPLRERRTDIPLFTEYFLDTFSRETATKVPVIEKKAREALLNYSWPGNVRELKNLMERLVIMSSDGVITFEDLPESITGGLPAVSSESVNKNATLKQARGDFEKEFIEAKLREFNSNVQITAEAIGVERSHLYRKIKSYGIKVK